jgi:outer membrane protein OmpA-like peptidoglycan-associated protein
MEPNRFNIVATGTSLFVCLVWLTVGNVAPAIESELTATAAQLAGKGEDLNWIKPTVDGQALELVGYVPDHQAYRRAADMAEAMDGFSSIANNLKLVGTEGSCQEELSSTLSHERIQFKPGSFHISSNSDFLLKMLAVVARNCNTLITIAGHTDATGNPDSNQRLSELRALAVRKYLVSSGVAARQLTSIGYGDSKPIYDNSTTEGRDRNRRIEFTVSHTNT